MYYMTATMRFQTNETILCGDNRLAQSNGLAGFIFNIANKLRGPYRPPQDQRVRCLRTVSVYHKLRVSEFD